MEVDNPHQPKIASALIIVEERGVDMQSGFPSIMMTTPRVPECSLTTELVEGKAPITGVSPIQVSSPSSKEHINYFGNHYDFGNEPLWTHILHNYYCIPTFIS